VQRAGLLFSYFKSLSEIVVVHGQRFSLVLQVLQPFDQFENLGIYLGIHDSGWSTCDEFVRICISALAARLPSRDREALPLQSYADGAAVISDGWMRRSKLPLSHFT